MLKIDSSESLVHGNQEGFAYNGHFILTCYHTLFCFNNFGDREGAATTNQMCRKGAIRVVRLRRWKRYMKDVD
jgi:hypothetical protein